MFLDRRLHEKHPPAEEPGILRGYVSSLIFLGRSIELIELICSLLNNEQLNTEVFYFELSIKTAGMLRFEPIVQKVEKLRHLPHN